MPHHEQAIDVPFVLPDGCKARPYPKTIIKVRALCLRLLQNFCQCGGLFGITNCWSGSSFLPLFKYMDIELHLLPNCALGLHSGALGCRHSHGLVESRWRKQHAADALDDSIGSSEVRLHNLGTCDTRAWCAAAALAGSGETSSPMNKLEPVTELVNSKLHKRQRLQALRWRYKMHALQFLLPRIEKMLEMLVLTSHLATVQPMRWS
eukprot:1142980-Pelagomonas_calceolata.AAC.2